MIEEKLKRMTEMLETAERLPAGKKRELLELVRDLRGEIEELDKTDTDQAKSVAGFAEISTHEATRSTTNPDRLKLSLDGLASAIDELEVSHPRLVSIINRVSMMLSDIGI